MCRSIDILGGIGLTIAICLTASGQQIKDSVLLASPDAAVEYLVSLRHGLTFLDEEAQRVLEGVKAKPETYVGALQKILSIPLDDQLLSSLDDVHRLSRALDLARQMDSRHTGNVVHRFFDATARVSRNLRSRRQPAERVDPDSRLERAYRNVVLLRDDSLKVLSDFNDPYSVDVCVDSIEEERKTTSEVVMLQYLEKVGPLRPDIRPKLEEMYNSPDSPLRNNPQLLRVLEAMDTADREKNQDKKNPEFRPKGERNP